MKKEKTPEEKRIARQIRNGTLPRYHFAKEADLNGKMERESYKHLTPRRIGKKKLSWRLVSTYAALTNKDEK